LTSGFTTNLPALQLVGDARARLERREAGDRHFADHREEDGAALGDARLGGELGVAEDGDAHHVAHAERLEAHVGGGLGLGGGGRACAACGCTGAT
jgi:hypothetical protein